MRDQIRLVESFFKKEKKLFLFYKNIINPLSASVALTSKPVNWFAQIQLTLNFCFTCLQFKTNFFQVKIFQQCNIKNFLSWQHE